jgi:hypothetical protein
LVGRDRRARQFGDDCANLRAAQDERESKKFRDCIRIAALLREPKTFGLSFELQGTA